MEAGECMIVGRWLDLASLMLTSADLVFPKKLQKKILSASSLSSAILLRSLKVMISHWKLRSSYPQKLPNNQPNSCTAIEDISSYHYITPFRRSIVSCQYSHHFFGLFNLYNVLENPYGRCLVYIKALEVAAPVSLNISYLLVRSFPFCKAKRLTSS